MTYVLEGLFLGDADDASNVDKLLSEGVTHLLTIEQRPLPLSQQQSFVYKHVYALDMEEFDLLSTLPHCIKFIEEGRTHGAVLVHCFAGESRSATAVIAYVMQKFQLSLQEAVTLVRKQRPQIGPNPGFMHQLDLFQAMENKVEVNSQCYKQFRLNHIAQQVQQGGNLSELLTQLSDPSNSQDSSDVFYKCKKCRRLLFRQSSVLPHEQGLGDAAFDWRKTQAPVSASSDSVCSLSLFIEPVRWMQADLLSIEGKLSCPKCNSKLGSFNWYGERCPCGSWITPSIHIHNTKVDRCQPPPKNLRTS